MAACEQRVQAWRPTAPQSSLETCTRMTCCRFIRLTINLCPNCSLSKPYTSEHDNGDKKQSDFIVDKYQQCSVQCYYSEKCKVFSSVVLILVIAHRPSHRDGGVQATIKSTLVQELRTSRMVVPKVKPFRPYNQIGPLCLVYCVFTMCVKIVVPSRRPSGRDRCRYLRSQSPSANSLTHRVLSRFIYLECLRIPATQMPGKTLILNYLQPHSALSQTSEIHCVVISGSVPVLLLFAVEAAAICCVRSISKV